MAWSPFQRANAGIIGVEQPGDYANLIPTTFATGPGRAWLSAIKEKVQSVAAMRANVEGDKRWVTVAFTWNGLRALGLDEASLATFPEEFREGMVARAETLGDTGSNAPEHWVGGVASPDLHAIAILLSLIHI